MGLIRAAIKRVFGLKQQVPKQSAPKTQAYYGSGYGNYGYTGYGGSSGGSKWPYGLSTYAPGLILNNYALRHQARSAYHDTTQARALVDRYADTVVDVGIFLESMPSHRLLGISPEQAEKWSSDVEERFNLWAMDRNQHRSGTMNLYQAQRFYEIGQQRDNDIFVRLFYSRDSNLLNPLQYEFIDPDQIRGDELVSTYATYFNADGIIRDKQGREKGYKIWWRDPVTKTYKETTIPRVGEKSKRLFMLHGFTKEYAAQGRGYSRLSHALQEFENLTDFTSAQIKKAIMQSSITMYTKPSPDNAASNPFEDILTDRGVSIATDQFSGTSSDSGGAAPTTQPVGYCPLPEVTLDTPGSVGVFNLQQGEDLKAFENKTPSDSYATFVDAFTSYLTASSSMPLEVMLMKFDQNYSASRGALILFWRVAQIWRGEMASDFLNPLYKMWLSEEIAAGRIMAPGWADVRLRAAWLNSKWLGAPMPNIDPMRTAKADKEYMTMGAQTGDMVARNLNGSNGTMNRAKLIREYKELPTAPWDQKGGT